ncbi:MAG: ABC transporter substrate-binding protein [Acidimicrobiales bacterium]|nr:ABC transporter substrate-binding protein [Acidimicrobiales bacterium]
MPRPMLTLSASLLSLALVAGACGDDSELIAAQEEAAAAQGAAAAAQGEAAAAQEEAAAAQEEAAAAQEEAAAAKEAAAAAAGSDVDLREVVVSEKAEVYNFDPKNSAGGEFDAPLFTSVFETLVRTTPSGLVEPLLAESWSMADDKMSYTFNLRQGVKFHNGESLTCADVKYSVDRAVSDGIPMVQQRADNLAEITCTDDYTAVYHMVEPDTTFVYTIGDSTGLGFSSILTSTNSAQGTSPVGTGPFTFVSYVPGSALVLDVNRDYWNPSALPDYDRLQVRIIKEDASMVAALRAGEVALIHPTSAATTAGLRGDGSVTIDDIPTRTFWIHASKVGKTRDDNLVKALWLCMDRQALADVVYMGEAVPWSTAHPLVEYALKPEELPNYTRDVAAGKKLIADNGLEGTQLDFVYPTRAPYEDVFFEVLQASWAECGIEVQLSPVEQAVWIPKLINADYDLSSTDQGWYSNPYRYVLPRTGWQAMPDEILPELIPALAALAEATPEERPEAFRAVQMMEAENAYPYSGTVYTNTGHIYRNDLLSNADHSWYLTGDKRVLYLSLTPAD